MISNLYGEVRQKIAKAFGGGDAKAAMNNRGDLCMAQALPAKAEIARLGASYHASIPTGSAFTTVAAWPTTRAELVLSNVSPAGGPSLIIDRIWFSTIVTETAASAYTILCQMSPAGLVAVAADNTAVLVRNLNGKSGGTQRSANASLAVAHTAFGVARQWDVPEQAAFGTNLAAVSLGAGAIASINGGYIVQPQATFIMNAVVGTAVAAAGIMGVVWHEATLDLG